MRLVEEGRAAFLQRLPLDSRGRSYAHTVEVRTLVAFHLDCNVRDTAERGEYTQNFTYT